MSSRTGDPSRGHERTPLVEVNVSYEHGPSPNRRKLSEAVEVITRNHTYVLDSSMRCIEVRKAGSGEVVPDSTFLKSRLVGGQVNTPESTELSYPFPRPGSTAVFETQRGSARQFHHTSPVVRVVLRLSILSVTSASVTPTWEQISRATDADS